MSEETKEILLEVLQVLSKPTNLKFSWTNLSQKLENVIKWTNKITYQNW